MYSGYIDGPPARNHRLSSQATRAEKQWLHTVHYPLRYCADVAPRQEGPALVPHDGSAAHPVTLEPRSAYLRRVSMESESQ